MNSLLGLLGLGLRGGNLVVGADGVRTALQGGKCLLVVLASDASPRARDKVVRLAQARAVELVTGPPAQAMGDQLGRPPVMAVGVRDAALARGIRQAAGGQA
ncbi:MAG: ribosomal L7Ae/L30e/S12e/Gadd45 family protein [Gemmatimonadota bacterium]|jgi:ribosomal protein L7Ae-like RNA K-turn-binding protein|nr:ribosomal L7Ae/L30e/S12e/Gadd45 family protein [Gemmatimonadota bacterium]